LFVSFRSLVAQDLAAKKGGNPQLQEIAARHKEFACFEIEDVFPEVDRHPKPGVFPYPRVVPIAFLHEIAIDAAVSLGVVVPGKCVW